MRDYMIRRDQALQARGDAPCEGCGHALRDHRELASAITVIEDGKLVMVPNPEYHPFHSHCGVEGCDCVRDHTA